MKIIILGLAIAACGGSTKKPADHQEPARPMVWADMDHKAREAFMKDVVLPRMKTEFAAFDPKFQSMDCKTCHGAGAEDGSFDMPNPKIKPLPNTEAAFGAWVTKEPEAGRYAQFMSQKVEPMMAEMLHLHSYDPKTKTGEFGCSSCHTLVDETGKIVPDESIPHHHHDHDEH